MRGRLSPGVVAGFLVVLTAAAVCIRLGLWQWERAQDSGRFLNYSYAVEWGLFAFFALAAWVKIRRDDRRAAAQPPPPVPVAPAKPVVVDEDLDDETRAYNAYLAELAKNPRR